MYVYMYICVCICYVLECIPFCRYFKHRSCKQYNAAISGDDFLEWVKKEFNVMYLSCNNKLKFSLLPEKCTSLTLEKQVEDELIT